jgi:hypothetical protein
MDPSPIHNALLALFFVQGDHYVMPREILLFLYVPNAPMEEIKREAVYVHGGSCTLEVQKHPWIHALGWPSPWGTHLYRNLTLQH